jgi:hypothetical protein
MGVQQNRNTKTAIDVRVFYGLGESVFGRFPRDEIAGFSARDLVNLVIEGPHAPGAATRTAKVLADVLQTERVIDAELFRAAASATGATGATGAAGETDGAPISLDDVVVREGEKGEGEEQHENSVKSEEITIRLSESYRGGRTAWLAERRSAAI